MCFSETASFTAATVLTVQGLASLRLVQKYRPYLLIACIPLFFAIQQFSEGMIWHYFNQGYPIQGYAIVAAYVFLIFAYICWPVVIPLSLWIAETDISRKRLLALFIVGGSAWSIYLLSLTPWLTLNVTNSGRGLLYEANYFSDQASILLKWIYLGLVIIPIFISSLRFVWVFGLVTFLSALITYYFYETTFTSVWCFFGAILSLILYKILKVNLTYLKS